MANTEFNVRIQLKRDTDANWRAKDPQLLAGEVVFVDTNAGEVRTKVGDGTKKYSALPFMDEVLRNLISNTEHLFKVKAVCDLLGNITTPTLLEHGDLDQIFSAAINTTQPVVAAIWAQDNENEQFLWPLVHFNTEAQKVLFIGTNGANVWWALECIQGTWSCTRIDLAKLTDIPTKLSQLENDTNYLNSDTNFVHKTGDEEIKGIKTFESSIICPMAPGNENHLVNKKYVDNKIPTALKNPYTLTVKGAISATYDGSKAISITIPDPGISETQADNKYLKLSGGAMTGSGIISNIGWLEFKYSQSDKRVILTANEDTFEIKGNLQITDVMIPTAVILKPGANGLIYTDNVITPTDNNQYVQKGYVDSVIGGIENGTY